MLHVPCRTLPPLFVPPPWVFFFLPFLAVVSGGLYRSRDTRSAGEAADQGSLGAAQTVGYGRVRYGGWTNGTNGSCRGLAGCAARRSPDGTVCLVAERPCCCDLRLLSLELDPEDEQPKEGKETLLDLSVGTKATGGKVVDSSECRRPIDDHPGETTGCLCCGWPGLGWKGGEGTRRAKLG